MVRTPAEVLARIESVKSIDIFGTIRSDLIDALPYEQAKPFLKEGVTEDQWPQKSIDAIKTEAANYLEFAFGKANGCRGLSASRSVDHYRAWMWLLGIEDFDKIADAEYEFYGKPVLVIVAAYLGVDWRAHDDGEWKNDERADGSPPAHAEVERLEKIGRGLKPD